jgi:hypothetical protein
MMRRITTSLITTICLVLGCARIGRGDTIVVSDLTANALTGVYTYLVQFTNTALVKPGDGFVVYDFKGLSPANIATQVFFSFTSPVPVGATFTPSEMLIGNAINPALNTALTSVLHLTDSPSIYNLSLVYSGPTIAGSATGVLTIRSNLFGPHAFVIYNLGVLSKDSGGGILAASLLDGPGGSGSTVPLPATVAGGGVLMIGLLAARFSRRIIASRSALIA